ncbi:hypothetical protein [Yersinia sp. LJYL362]
MLVIPQSKRMLFMTQKVISAGRTIESVAYDMALALASRDDEILTAEQMIQRIESLMPACFEAAKKQDKKEYPMVDIGMFR